MAYESDNYLYGRTNNPWNLDYTAGGSSGGEAAAIASGCSAGGFGSDGGGSVRVPAHFSGICGLKPTPGVIPRTGHWPACLGPSAFLGLIGPMARTVEDVRLLLEVTAGVEHHDPSAAPVEMRAPSEAELHSVKVGWFADNGRHPVTPETRQAVERAAKALEDQGFAVEEVKITGLEEAPDLWWTLFGVVATTALQPMIAGREDQLHPLSQSLMATQDEGRGHDLRAIPRCLGQPRTAYARNCSGKWKSIRSCSARRPRYRHFATANVPGRSQGKRCATPSPSSIRRSSTY